MFIYIYKDLFFDWKERRRLKPLTRSKYLVYKIKEKSVKDPTNTCFL